MYTFGCQDGAVTSMVTRPLEQQHTAAFTKIPNYATTVLR